MTAGCSPGRRDLVDVGWGDVEIEAGASQELGAAWRGRGEDEAHAQVIVSLEFLPSGR